MDVNTVTDDDADGQDLFDAIVEAYNEYAVTVSIPPAPDSTNDFDYTYRVVSVSPELGEATLLASNERNGGVEYLKVSTTSGGSSLEAYHLTVKRGHTFIGNISGVRKSRFQ